MCHTVCLDCFTLEDGIDRLFRTVGNYNLGPHQIPEERRSQCCFSCRYRGV